MSNLRISEHVTFPLSACTLKRASLRLVSFCLAAFPWSSTLYSVDVAPLLQVPLEPQSLGGTSSYLPYHKVIGACKPVAVRHLSHEDAQFEHLRGTLYVQTQNILVFPRVS